MKTSVVLLLLTLISCKPTSEKEQSPATTTRHQTPPAENSARPKSSSHQTRNQVLPPELQHLAQSDWTELELFFQQRFQDDPVAALTLAPHLASLTSVEAVADLTHRQLYGQDSLTPSEVLGLILEIKKAPSLQAAVIEKSIPLSFQSDRAAVLTWVNENPKLPGLAAGLQTIGSYDGHPDHAADNLNQVLENGTLPAEVASSYFTGLALEWLAQDQPAALAFLKDLAGDPSFDHAVYQTAVTLAIEHPEAARYWADSITKPSLRQSANQSIDRLVK